jgi:hypothetical protein
MTSRVPVYNSLSLNRGFKMWYGKNDGEFVDNSKKKADLKAEIARLKEENEIQELQEELEELRRRRKSK